MIWLLALVGCRHTLTFEVTRPAEIAVDQDIQKLAEIDRFGSDSAQSTTSAFIDELLLLESPRFSATSRQAARNATAQINATEGAPLAPEHTRKLCEDLAVTGIVSLEEMNVDDGWAFSTRTESETTTSTVNGAVREVTRDIVTHEATYTAEIATTWRLYSCEGRVRDFYQTLVTSSWYGEGSSRADARTNVGETDALMEDLAVTAAWVYLKRISPYDVNISRRYYSALGGDLREGARYLRDGQLTLAEETLRSGARSASGKKKGKLLYDLAVVSEQKGELDTALSQARRAHKLLDSALSEELVRRLRARARQESEIKSQLDEPAPTPILAPPLVPTAPINGQ
jgi:hypothetical protein